MHHLGVGVSALTTVHIVLLLTSAECNTLGELSVVLFNEGGFMVFYDIVVGG